MTPAEARALQEELRGRNVLRPPAGFRPRLVAGADVSVGRREPVAHAAVAVVDLDSMAVVDRATAAVAVTFPYVPGLLGFRELPAVRAAWERLETSPDVVLFDAHGLAHPRRFGLGCHGGFELGVPSVGCAKSRLVGEHAEPGPEKGAHTPLLLEGEVVGAVVRTRSGVKPVYVSPGYRMDVPTAVATVLRATGRYRIPEPIRESHRLAGRARAASGGAGERPSTASS